MNRKSSKLLSLILSLGIIISLMAILPTVVQGENPWLTMTDWESDDPVSKIPTSLTVELGDNTSIAVKTLESYKVTGTNATNPYKEDSKQGLQIYNQLNKVCNPGAKSAPTSILLDAEKMKDAKDLRVSMHIKEKTTYNEQFNIGVTVDGVVYYAPLTASDYYNFGMYSFKGKTMTAVDGTGSIELTAANISKITAMNFWVQTDKYSSIYADDIEYTTEGDADPTISSTTNAPTEPTTEEPAEGSWLTMTDWESDDPVSKIPTSLTVELGDNTSIAVKTLESYKVTGTNSTNPYKEDSKQGLMIYNQTNKVCNPGAKSAPTSILLDAEKMKNAKDLRVSMHIKEKPTYTEQFNIGVTVDGVVYYAPLTASDYYNFGMYNFKGKTMTAVDGSGTIALTADNICKITNMNFWVQTDKYSSIYADDIEYTSSDKADPTKPTEPTTNPSEPEKSAIEKLKDNMNLTWSDEFDGDSLNLDNWYYEHRDAPRNGQLHWYNDSETDNGNVQVKDGKLVITAKKEHHVDEKNNQTYEYTSGGIRTQDQINGKIKKTFKYGIMEARIKMPETTKDALWASFWMCGVNKDTGKSQWPYNGEVDIIEYLSRSPKEQKSGLHFNKYYTSPDEDPNGYQSTRYDAGPYAYTFTNGEAFNSDYHTVGYIWTDTTVSFYIDDIIFKTISITDKQFDAFRKYDFFFMITMPVGGSSVRNFDGSDLANPASEATNSMYVDYVRVYQSFTPIAEKITSTSIKLVARDGYEYSIDGKTWQTASEFTGLNENTEYTVYQRVAKTADAVASDIAQGLFKTKTGDEVETGSLMPSSTTKATTAPTTEPTTKPTTAPTTKPTTAPTTAPTAKPTTKPTTAPTTEPTTVPTPAALYGDANNDGSINMKDVLTLRKYIAGWNIEIDLTNADCDANDSINMKDVLLLRKFIAGWDVKLGK